MMSSGTSTDSRALTSDPKLRGAGPLATPQRSRSGATALEPWQLFTLAGLVCATVVVFLSRGQSPAAVILLSLMIFAAAAVGMMALRTFMPLTGATTDEGPQILGGRTRAALEREKALVLRSIKELEFDRAMGKMSEQDFLEMGTRLRARAAGLLRQLDAELGYREQIERDLEQRLAARGAPAARPVTSAYEQADEASVVGAEAAEERSVDTMCGSCQTPNDPDARFCKHCGSRLEMEV